MKKFFSLFCALAIVLSANAVPAKKLDGFAKMSKSNFEKQQVDKPIVKKAKAHQIAPITLKNVKAAKVATANRVPGAQLAPSAIKRAPAAKLETYNVAIEEYGAEFYDADNDLYFTMFDANGDYAFSVDVLLPDGETELTLGQTYTNMLLDYTRAFQYDESEEEYVIIGFAASASLVKTVDAEGLVRIEVSMTLENGDIYNLVYQEEPLPVATDTIDVAFAAEEVELTDYTATSGIFQFIGENADGTVYAAFYGNQIAGTYSADELYLDYTSIYLYGATDTTYMRVLAGDAVITFADNTFHVDAYYLGEDAHCYHVVMSYYQEPFVPTGDTIDVVITEPMTYSYYSSDGDWWIRGENDDYAVKLDLVNHNENSPAGSYAEADVLASYTYITNKATNTKLNLMELDAVVTDENGRIDLMADMLCDDGIVYHITMFYAIPEVQNYDTIVASNLQIEENSFYGYVLGYYLTASDENYEVVLSIDTIADGTYEASGSITNIATGVASNVYSGSIVLATAADGSRTVTGDVLCENNTLYTLNLTYVIPDATSQENVNLSGSITNYGTAWQFMGESGSFFASVAAFSATIPGTYGRADLAADYTYIVKFVGADTLYYDMVDANIVVAVSGDNATITGSLKGQNEDDAADVIEFILNLTANVEEAQEQGDPNDAQNEAFEYDFSEYSIDDQYLAQYNVFVVEAQNADNSYISIEFNVPAGSSELAAGEYPISASYEENTVSAGSLEDYIYGSFAGFILESGNFDVPLWLFKEGSVTVHESGVIVVNATNTWGVEIHSQLGSWPSAVENTDAAVKASKLVRNGHLMIIRNGVEYNAQGAVVK